MGINNLYNLFEFVSFMPLRHAVLPFYGLFSRNKLYILHSNLVQGGL